MPRHAPPVLLPQAARQEVQDKDILASQQEYRKGVSSWNFDVAALKAAAAAAREEEDEQRLPPISEYSGG
jgi:serine/threonine-protein kinase OSR1/STK39